MRATFSVNTYDRDGDLVEGCVILHVGGSVALKFANPSDLQDFADQIYAMMAEIRENYQA